MAELNRAADPVNEGVVSDQLILDVQVFNLRKPAGKQVS